MPRAILKKNHTNGIQFDGKLQNFAHRDVRDSFQRNFASVKLTLPSTPLFNPEFPLELSHHIIPINGVL